ncbi:hypothetical protein D3C72_2518440 [compost metagenome]
MRLPQDGERREAGRERAFHPGLRVAQGDVVIETVGGFSEAYGMGDQAQFVNTLRTRKNMGKKA